MTVEIQFSQSFLDEVKKHLKKMFELECKQMTMGKLFSNFTIVVSEKAPSNMVKEYTFEELKFIQSEIPVIFRKCKLFVTAKSLV